MLIHNRPDLSRGNKTIERQKCPRCLSEILRSGTGYSIFCLYRYQNDLGPNFKEQVCFCIKDLARFRFKLQNLKHVRGKIRGSEVEQRKSQ